MVSTLNIMFSYVNNHSILVSLTCSFPTSLYLCLGLWSTVREAELIISKIITDIYLSQVTVKQHMKAVPYFTYYLPMMYYLPTPVIPRHNKLEEYISGRYNLFDTISNWIHCTTFSFYSTYWCPSKHPGTANWFQISASCMGTSTNRSTEWNHSRIHHQYLSSWDWWQVSASINQHYTHNWRPSSSLYIQLHYKCCDHWPWSLHWSIHYTDAWGWLVP